MIFGIRAARGEDAHHLLDLDIKCFDHSWPVEQWRVAGGEFSINVATFYGTPIGMAVFMLGESNQGNLFVSLSKLAVKQQFRHRGVSSLLFATVERYAFENKARGIYATVPESMCLPGPRDVSGWLAKMGFKAVAVCRNCFAEFGEEEDGYTFEYQLLRQGQ